MTDAIIAQPHSLYADSSGGGRGVGGAECIAGQVTPSS